MWRERGETVVRVPPGLGPVRFSSQVSRVWHPIIRWTKACPILVPRIKQILHLNLNFLFLTRCSNRQLLSISPVYQASPPSYSNTIHWLQPTVNIHSELPHAPCFHPVKILSCDETFALAHTSLPSNVHRNLQCRLKFQLLLLLQLRQMAPEKEGQVETLAAPATGEQHPHHPSSLSCFF